MIYSGEGSTGGEASIPQNLPRLRSGCHKERRSNALQLIADGVSQTDEAMQLAQKWGCTRITILA